MKNLQTFEEFLNESYNGPVAVTFKDVPFSPISNILYFTMDGKMEDLDFRTWPEFNDKPFIALEKKLKSNGFDTEIDIKKRKVILNGFYEVFDANNNNSRLVQTSKNHTIEFNISNFYLKQGKVEYSGDRPN